MTPQVRTPVVRMKPSHNILSFGINGSLRRREVCNPQPYTEYYLFNSAANLKAYSNNGLDFAYYGYNATLPKYAFNAKELDEETGMYYYEARYYKPPVFTSRDAMMEKKPWLSPYHYCSNNPVGRVDPSGCDDDWYQSEDGTVGWTEGHAATVVDVNGKRYRNIGETYSKQNADGSYSNYYQNVGFKSNKKFNAKDYILNNDLVGKYISNNSPLSVSSKKELFQASIHHAQDVFIRYSVEGTANICNGLGTALSGAGMVTAAVPGVQVAAGGMVGCGSVLSSVGTGINCFLNIVDGDYRQAAVNATSWAVGLGTSKLWKSLNITTNQTNFLQGKTDFYNSTITGIITNGMDNKQKQ